MSIRVVIADDQRIVRDGLSAIVGLLDGIELAGAAADGHEAIDLIARTDPDIALMDLRMPNLDGIEATRIIRERHPRTHIIVLTTYADDDSIFAALRAGARGYLTKDAGADQIADAITQVARGEAMLDPHVQARLLDRIEAAPATRPPPEPLADPLTERETEVLRLIADGLSNAEIAAALYLGEATIKTHINRIFAKTGVRDRAQAVRYAYHHGIATP